MPWLSSRSSCSAWPTRLSRASRGSTRGLRRRRREPRLRRGRAPSRSRRAAAAYRRGGCARCGGAPCRQPRRCAPATRSAPPAGLVARPGAARSRARARLPRRPHSTSSSLLRQRAVVHERGHRTAFRSTTVAISAAGGRQLDGTAVDVDVAGLLGQPVRDVERRVVERPGQRFAQTTGRRGAPELDDELGDGGADRGGSAAIRPETRAALPRSRTRRRDATSERFAGRLVDEAHDAGRNSDPTRPEHRAPRRGATERFLAASAARGRRGRSARARCRSNGTRSRTPRPHPRSARRARGSPGRRPHRREQQGR